MFIHKGVGADHSHATVEEARHCWFHDYDDAWHEAEAKAEQLREAHWEQFLDNGGVHGERIAWEYAEDERRAAAF